jgi:hypothetical protein
MVKNFNYQVYRKKIMMYREKNILMAVMYISLLKGRPPPFFERVLQVVFHSMDDESRLHGKTFFPCNQLLPLLQFPY